MTPAAIALLLTAGIAGWVIEALTRPAGVRLRPVRARSSHR